MLFRWPILFNYLGISLQTAQIFNHIGRLFDIYLILLLNECFFAFLYSSILLKGTSFFLFFWFGGILGSASGAEFPVSLSNLVGFTPGVLQQHSPLTRKLYPSENWLRLFSSILPEIQFFIFFKPTAGVSNELMNYARQSKLTYEVTYKVGVKSFLLELFSVGAGQKKEILGKNSRFRREV